MVIWRGRCHRRVWVYSVEKLIFALVLGLFLGLHALSSRRKRWTSALNTKSVSDFGKPKKPHSMLRDPPTTEKFGFPAGAQYRVFQQNRSPALNRCRSAGWLLPFREPDDRLSGRCWGGVVPIPAGRGCLLARLRRADGGRFLDGGYTATVGRFKTRP